MKVVLFCGGLGMRMREGNSTAPKPMAMIGDRPLIWHVMRYYAYYGHTDFVLCLGYGASAVKDYFLNYDETTSNDFVLENGGRDIKLFSTDISDWRISFVDTGLNSPIGERLRRVKHLRAGRGDVPGQLRRRAHRRAAAGHDRAGSRAATRSPACLPRRCSPHIMSSISPTTAPSPGSSRYANSSSGRTAATSCCVRASSTSRRRARIWLTTRSAGSCRRASPRLPAQGFLDRRRHRQGPDPARGALSPRRVPVDGVGSGAIRRDPTYPVEGS